MRCRLAFLSLVLSHLASPTWAQVDPSVRGYWGGSFGGLFGAYALVTRLLPTRLYMAAGGEEGEERMLLPMRAFADLLQQRRYEGLEVEADIVPGENHFTIAPIGIARGLMRMFPRPPDDGE